MPDYGSADAGGFVALRMPRPHGARRRPSVRGPRRLLIQPEAPARRAPGALLLTTLRVTTALVLLNVSLGDRAVIDRRRCGCPLEAQGWPVHLRPSAATRSSPRAG